MHRPINVKLGGNIYVGCITVINNCAAKSEYFSSFRHTFFYMHVSVSKYMNVIHSIRRVLAMQCMEYFFTTLHEECGSEGRI
jgi:hypothetical protein